MSRIVEPCLRDFRPELVLVACGFDASAYDPMARMVLTAAGFRGLTQKLLQLSDNLCEGRLAMVSEGGYSPVYSPLRSGRDRGDDRGRASDSRSFEPFVGGAVAGALTDAQAASVDNALHAWATAPRDGPGLPAVPSRV